MYSSGKSSASHNTYLQIKHDHIDIISRVTSVLLLFPE